MTAITNTLSFTMGVTFDYYSVNGADASTYLNRDYYESAYNTLLDYYEDLGRDEAYMLANDPTAQILWKQNKIVQDGYAKLMGK